MSVNGSGTDTKTGKPLPESATWVVRTPAGGPIRMPKDSKKTATGLTASEAFALVRSHRARTGEYVVAVRT